MRTPLLFLLICCACGGPVLDESSDVDSEGKADSLGGASIDFQRGFHQVVSGQLRAQGKVTVSYARERLYDVLNWSDGSGLYLASSFHCYGYGCCDVGFPQVNIHYRFFGGAFSSASLPSNNQVQLSIPAGAHDLEIYLDAPGYDLKTWYCGCDTSCSSGNRAAASSNHHQRTLYDSRYGQNFHFSIATK